MCAACITPVFAKAVLAAHVRAKRIPVDASINGRVEEIERVRLLVEEAATRA